MSDGTEVNLLANGEERKWYYYKNVVDKAVEFCLVTPLATPDEDLIISYLLYYQIKTVGALRKFC